MNKLEKVPNPWKLVAVLNLASPLIPSPLERRKGRRFCLGYQEKIVIYFCI
jgi:hypothetical protein